MPHWSTLSKTKELFADGQTISIGGMTLYRRPMALVRELLRSGAKELTLLSLTSGIESDLLVGRDRVVAVRTCYFGLEIFGLAPMFTAGASAGRFRIVEETEATIAQGLAASLNRVGHMPTPGLVGTDLMKVRTDLKLVTCPYSGARHVAVPALRPDVALIHAACADESGNVVFGGNLAIDKQIALLAPTVVISVERIVPRDQLPDRGVDLTAREDATLVHVPSGAWPTSCFPQYALDGRALLSYVVTAGTGGFDRWYDAFMIGPEAVKELATQEEEE